MTRVNEPRRLVAVSAALALATAWLPQLRNLLIQDARAQVADYPEIMYDSDGLIVHKNNDGGDTAQREGWYWTGTWIRANVLGDPWAVPRKLSFAEVLNLLEPKRDGVFYRHPKLPPWNNPYDKEYGFSRDQMVPLVAAMGLWGHTEELRRLWNALPQDPFLGTKHTFNGEWKTLLGVRTAYSGDVIGPMTINLFRRAWNENPMVASDGNGPGGEKELLANAALRVPPALNDRDNTGDDLNLIVMLLMANLRYPSAISSEATTLYAKNRLVSYGSFIRTFKEKYGIDLARLGTLPVKTRQDIDAAISARLQTDCSRVFGAVRWYHREGSGANPRLAELYRPIVARYLE